MLEKVTLIMDPVSMLPLPVYKRNRGSALVATLTMMGILGIVIAAMLYSVSAGARSTRDKVAYEQAYHAALGGTHIARAWMIHPHRYASQTGESFTAIDKLTTDAVKMSRDLIKNNYDKAHLGPGAAAEWFGGGTGQTLADGRVVLFNFPANIVKNPNDVSQTTFTSSLFNKNITGAQSFVESLRITTPGTTTETQASLREVSVIIESKGVSMIGGSRKERTIMQKVLVYPTIEAGPLVSAGEAIIGGSGLNVSGNSHFNVHWGPVKAKGHVKLLDFKVNNGLTKSLEAVSPGKFFGAGFDATDGSSNMGLDKWLKWQVGTGSVLTGDDPTVQNPTRLFPDIGGVQVTDFFAQLVKGEFNSAGWTAANTLLTGHYSGKTTMANGHLNGLWSLDANGQPTDGAFQQNNPDVNIAIDRFFNETMDYETMKAYAVSHNGYVAPIISGNNKISHYVNQFGQNLYVTPQRQITTNMSGNARLTNLHQLSMSNLQPTGTTTWNTHTDGANKVDDRMLFVDYPGGDKNYSGLPAEHSVSSGFFWKGVMYVCGDLDASGAGSSPQLRIKNPDQFDLDSTGDTGFIAKNVIMDGILNVRGSLKKAGNAVIYGTLATTGMQDSAGTPVIWYNTANAQGRLKAPSPKPYDFQLIAGRILEAKTWL